MPSRQPKLLPAEKLLEYGVRLLGGRAFSSGELRQKLRMKAEKKEDADLTIARLKDLGYLNDKRFAESFATARVENQGFGKMRVLRDLRQKRVAPKVAESAVSQAFEGSDEAAMIEAYLQRKFRGADLGATLQDEKKLASAFRRLRNAGFSAGNSIRVLKKFAARAEELESLDEPEDPAD
jgi:regulatory protein